MKPLTKKSFLIWNLLMIPAGIVLIALDGLLMVRRFQNPELSRILVLFATLLLLAAGICEIAAGIRSISLSGSISRNMRPRAVGSKIRILKRLALAAIILCLAELILSILFGIIIWQLAVLLAAGILVPLICLISASKL